MNAQIRNGLKSGVVFGIILLFLVLIKFEVIAATLLGKALPSLKTGSLSENMVDMLVFISLLGIWAGARGAKPGSARLDTWKHSLAGGVAAGLTMGIVTALFTLLVARSYASGIDLRKYLPAMGPDNLGLYLLGKDPAGASWFYLVLMVLSGLLGAVLARISRGSWRRSFSTRLRAIISSLASISLISRLRSYRFYRYILYGILLILILLLPLRLGSYWNYIFGIVGIYVLLGLGLNIVVGLAGLLDLGYVAFFAIGAYTIGLLTAPEPHHLQWNFWIVLPIGILLAALAGVLLGVPVLRLRGDYLAIVTLGFGEIIRIMIRSDVMIPLTSGPRGVRDIAGPTLFGRPFQSDVDFVYLIIAAVLLVIFVTNRLYHSRVGRAWIAMREDEIVAQAQGINTLRAKLLAFGIGAAFAGLGGVLFASRNQFTGPEDHTLMVSINVLATVIVGGMGSIPGVIAGAFVLKGLPEVLRELDVYRILAFGALLVVMMVMRPEGLIPSQRRRLEMHTLEEDTLPEPVQPVSPDGGSGEPAGTSPEVVIAPDVEKP